MGVVAHTRREQEYAPERLEGVRAGNVRVEDEEGGVVLAKNLTGQSEGTSWEMSDPADMNERTSAERLSLNREADLDAVLLLGLLKDGNHDLGAVVDSEDNVLDAGLNGQHP